MSEQMLAFTRTPEMPPSSKLVQCNVNSPALLKRLTRTSDKTEFMEGRGRAMPGSGARRLEAFTTRRVTMRTGSRLACRR